MGPSPALLLGATSIANRRLGRADGGNLWIADVTGDGAPDVITSDERCAMVWSAPDPRATSIQPTAVLCGSDPTVGFTGGAQDLLLADVTMDGILDIVAVASIASIGGVANVGEICVFAGGPALSGTPAPVAKLRIPGAIAGDQLGDPRSSLNQGVVIADVTGDGVAEIVAVAANADRGATTNVGMTFVWSGGAALTGTPAPLATLDAAAAKGGDLVGSGSAGPFIVDLTGDGVQDILLPGTNVGSSGSMFLWHGGAALAGTLDATARLRAAAAQPNDYIGQRAYFHDFDHDGTLDLLLGASATDIGTAKDAGSLYWWRGGSRLTGLVFESAMLRRATPAAHDAFGGAAADIQIVDVTGDGAEDIVVTSSRADGAAVDSGAITVFAGGSGFSGTVLPSAELQVPGALAKDYLGDATHLLDPVCAVVIADVTGDSIRDVVAAAPYADRGTKTDVGAVWVWAGGAALTGGAIVAPIAELRPTQTYSNVFLGLHYDYGFAIQCGDFDGAAIDDVIVPIAPSGISDASVLVFAGGARMTGTPLPLASCDSDSTSGFDHLGLHGEGFVLVDVDGDLKCELVAHAPRYDRDHGAGFDDTGALFVFEGGPLATGTPIVLQSSVADNGAGVFGEMRSPRDLDGDGITDLWLLQRSADVQGSPEAGQLLLWRSGLPSQLGGSMNGHYSKSGTISLPPPPPGPPKPFDMGEVEVAATLLFGAYGRLGD